jgi:hypothetical protein
LEFIGCKLYWIVYLVTPKAGEESLEFIRVTIVTIRLARLEDFSWILSRSREGCGMFNVFFV